MTFARPDRTSDAIILVPGILGSELKDREGAVVWGLRPSLILRQLALGDVLKRLALPSGGEDDGIYASGIIGFPAHLPLLTAAQPYRKLLRRLQTWVLRPEAVLPFPYDWRRSIRDSAKELTAVATAHLSNWRRTWEKLPQSETRRLPEPRLSLVCHSMGGLVARWFAEVEHGREIVNRIITLGTPFAGSLNAVRVLATGDYLPFRLYSKALRDAGRTMPGLYELVASYRCVATGTGADEGEEISKPEFRSIAPADLEGVGASADLAAAAFETHRQMGDAVRSAGDRVCPIEPLVGVKQPTLQTVRFTLGTATFEERLDGVDYQGDGTVYRYSAAPKNAHAMPLAQKHESLARSEEALTFVEAKLTERDLGEVQAPPGIGIRVPPAVAVGQPFDVQIDADPSGVTCWISDAATNRQIDVFPVSPRTMTATFRVPAGGVYRVCAAGGGYSPIETMVTAFQD